MQLVKINPTGFPVLISSPYVAHRTDLSPVRRAACASQKMG